MSEEIATDYSDVEKHIATQIELDPNDPEGTYRKLKEAAEKLTPEEREANKQRLLANARRDGRPIATRVRNIAGSEFGLPLVSVIVVQTPHHIRVELHKATREEYLWFRELYLPSNPTAVIEIRKRDNNRASAPIVRAWLRKQAGLK